jgi:putative ATP-dependent endonuclease of the OLD family
MYVARVHLHRFRGYLEQVIMPARHAVVVGEPRAGRTDLIMGLRRALDPRSWSPLLQQIEVDRREIGRRLDPVSRLVRTAAPGTA